MSEPSTPEAPKDPGPVLFLGIHWFTDDRGGLNRYLLDLLGAYKDVGEVRAVVIGPAEDRPPYVRPAGSAAQRLPLRLLRYAQVAHEAAAGAAVVNGHFALFTAAALTRRSVRSLPLVVHFHGPWAAETQADGVTGRLPVLAKHQLERWVYRRAQAMVVLSSAFKRVLVEDYGVSPWKITVIRPGVDLERFSPGDRAAARRALDLPPDAFIAVSTRRLIPRTGVDLLLDAWSQLDDRSGALLVIAGVGPERERLEAQAERAGIADRVRFLGEISDPDLVELYRSADVSVVPSRSLEGFGLVVLEAAACGTPAIGTEVGGLAEAVAIVDPGLVVPDADPGALTERLHRAMTEATGLPDRARCRAAAEAYSWTRAAEVHQQVFRAAKAPSPDRPRRIAYLDHTAQISGAEVSLARLLPALEGVDPHVILATDGPLVTLLLRSGCSTEVVPLRETSRALGRSAVSPRRLPLRTALDTSGHVVRLARHLRRLEPDVVHTNSLKSALYGGLAGRLAGIPVVWQINDRLAEDYLPRVAVRLMRAAARLLPAHIIANSAATATTLPTRRPITVIPAPIPAPPVGVTRTGPPSAGLRIGIVGRLSPWKGQDLFLRAFAAAFPDGDATAVVVGAAQFGEDEIEPGLRALAADLGISPRVHLLGHRDDIVEVMSGLDVLVHASVIPEPFGMVVVEGMALGLPVVAADAAGPAEVIDHGVNGLLYPMGDAEALAAALRLLAGDDALRRRLGEAGRERSADFAPSVVAAAVEGVYAEVLSDRRQRTQPARRGVRWWGR